MCDGGFYQDELLLTLLLEPCGMDNTFFKMPAGRGPDLLRSYGYDPAQLVDISGQIDWFKTWRGSDGVCRTVGPQRWPSD